MGKRCAADRRRLPPSRAILEVLGSEHELALTLIEQASLLEGPTQRETLGRARDILIRLSASAEAEGVKRLMAAYSFE
jgi:hypothetical protein